jgi:hypothetical protein
MGIIKYVIARNEAIARRQGGDAKFAIASFLAMTCRVCGTSNPNKFTFYKLSVVKTIEVKTIFRAVKRCRYIKTKNK